MPDQSPQPAPALRIKQEDLCRLVCSVCHQVLELESESIRCTVCSRRYPIVDGIPVLLPARTS